MLFRCVFKASNAPLATNSWPSENDPVTTHSELRQRLGRERLLRLLVLHARVPDAVDGKQQQALALQRIQRGAGPRAVDEEGVRGETCDGDELSGGLHGVAEGLEVRRVFQREVDARLALGVRPGAVGCLAGPGLAGLYGRVQHGLDLLHADKPARRRRMPLRRHSPRTSEGGEEDGCCEDGKAGRAMGHNERSISIYKMQAR